jgi:hypothetical protein
MDPSNLFMLTCVGIIVLLAFINCIYRSQLCCLNKCFKYNNNYNIIKLENIIEDKNKN